MDSASVGKSVALEGQAPALEFAPELAPEQAAVFFDRDGVLNEDYGYPSDPAKLVWRKGAKEAIAIAHSAGRRVIVVINQSGIGRGLFARADTEAFHAAMQAGLAAQGVQIDAFFLCPYHEEAVLPGFHAANHPDRKPNPGMVRRVMTEWAIDPDKAILIGDRASDMGAARAAGIRGFLLGPDDDLAGLVSAQIAAKSPSADKGNTLLAVLHARALIGRDWLFTHGLPLWAGPGFDDRSQCFHERLSGALQPVSPFRRVRVQARQTYVFSAAAALGWEGPWQARMEAGLAMLHRAGLHPDGGTHHRLGEGLSLPDSRRDLYDTAFVIFALARAAGKSSDRAAHLAAANALSDWVETHWAHPDGSFFEGEIDPVPPRRQNPHMHYLEALLALFDAQPDARSRSKLHERITYMLDLFVGKIWDPASGLVRECFDSGRDRLRANEDAQGGDFVVEPMHLFEWAWLLEAAARFGFADHRKLADILRLNGEAWGIEPGLGLAINSMAANGAPIDPGFRLWPQGERLKANLAWFDRTQAPWAIRNAIVAFDG